MVLSLDRGISGTMPRTRMPRSGSMQFWPRKKAKRQHARVRFWNNNNQQKLLGFAGYKVGMVHVVHTDNRKATLTKNQEISTPATLIECPPIKVIGILYYAHDEIGRAHV